MDLKDLIVTPLLFIAILIIAYLVRPFFTNQNNRRYFMPALLIRMIAAILVGVLYQYYYNGGDTFNFHTRGSVLVVSAIYENPVQGFKMLVSDGEDIPRMRKYYSRIPFYRDRSSYMIVRIAAIIDLITFKTYSATALFFALFSFSGLWAMYSAFQKRSPGLSTWLALFILFVPSVVFWGSGILKDTITIGCMGWITYALYNFFIEQKTRIKYLLILIVMVYLVWITKSYILLSFAPPALGWIVLQRIIGLRRVAYKILFGPVILTLGILLTYYAFNFVAIGDSRYSLGNIAQTSKITAYDISRYSGKDAGSTYNLGDLDGTFEGMLRLLPQAINVSLFRPYPWEAHTILMLMATLESLSLFVITIFVLIKTPILRSFQALNDPIVLFCLTFALIYAFGIGVSTYNFGTLMRYKIPLMPFYLCGLLFIYEKGRKRA